MRYRYHISFSGEVESTEADEASGETLEDIQKVVRESFRPNLMAGVDLQSLNIDVRVIDASTE